MKLGEDKIISSKFFKFEQSFQNYTKYLNISAFAWGINEHNELHSENGYITMREGSTRVALTTVMNNGIIKKNLKINIFKDL